MSKHLAETMRVVFVSDLETFPRRGTKREQNTHWDEVPVDSGWSLSEVGSRYLAASAQSPAQR